MIESSVGMHLHKESLKSEATNCTAVKIYVILIGVG